MYLCRTDKPIWFCKVEVVSQSYNVSVPFSSGRLEQFQANHIISEGKKCGKNCRDLFKITLVENCFTSSGPDEHLPNESKKL